MSDDKFMAPIDMQRMELNGLKVQLNEEKLRNVQLRSEVLKKEAHELFLERQRLMQEQALLRDELKKRYGISGEFKVDKDTGRVADAAAPEGEDSANIFAQG